MRRSFKVLQHSCRRVEGKPVGKSYALFIGYSSACTTGVWCLLVLSDWAAVDVDAEWSAAKAGVAGAVHDLADELCRDIDE